MKFFIAVYILVKLIEVDVSDVIPQEGGFLLLLKDKMLENYLPISIGENEGISILREMNKEKPPRPMTYELTNAIIEKLGAKVEKVVIDRVDENIFYSKIYLKQGKKEIVIDSRPSDAVNIAIRKKVKIFVEKEVFEKMGIKPSKKVKEGFKI